jgi:hypothetical protein
LKGRRTVHVLWGFKAFCSKQPKEVEGSIRASRNQSIQGGSRKGKGKSGSRENKECAVGKSLNQCNKDGHGAGHESSLSTVVKSYFGISQFLISSAEIEESLMETKHRVVKCSLKIGDKIIDKHNLINCRATGIAFVDKDCVHHH